MHMSLTPPSEFSRFAVMWNCLVLKLWNVLVICPYTPHGLAHGSHIDRSNRWVDFLCWKFHGIVSTCSCVKSWSFPRLTFVSVPMVTNLNHTVFPMHISENARWIYSVRNGMAWLSFATSKFDIYWLSMGLNAYLWNLWTYSLHSKL